MSFLGMGTFEILIILLVAFIFLGPERMIDAARTLGKWTGELRRMGSTVQAEMEDITNIGDPLSSRPGPTRNNSREGAPDTPMDQDHPTPFRPQPVENQASPPDGEESHTVSNTPENSAQPAADDTNPARKEESA